MTDLSFEHVFRPGADDLPPLLLLHGTGGDERDMLPLGPLLAPGAALLSPRGKVLERGAPRFFRRHAEGVLDEDDLRFRTHELADFVAGARAAYGLAAPIAVGFSNGANISASMLLLRPEALAGAVLIRAMAPFREAPAAPKARRRALILSGAMDPIVPEESALSLASMLEAEGAEVERVRLPAGHGIVQADIAAARGWIRAFAPAAGAVFGRDARP